MSLPVKGCLISETKGRGNVCLKGIHHLSQPDLRRVLQRIGPILYKVFLYAFLLGMAYVLLYPLLIIISKSFRPQADMYNPSIIWISSGVTADNIKMAIQALNYFPTLVLTVRVVLLNTLLSLVVCSMTGYALGRFKMRKKPLFVGLTLATIIVPVQTYIIPLYFQFAYFDFWGIGQIARVFRGEAATVSLINSESAYYMLNLFGCGLRSGLFILIFMQFFKNLPKELESAARVDGCSEFRIFTRIMIPNMGPAFLVVFLFSVVWNWNDYYLGQLLMRRKMLLANKLGMVKELVNAVINPGGYGDGVSGTVVVFSSTILFILPPLILYIFAQRRFIQSVERSGIVG